MKLVHQLVKVLQARSSKYSVFLQGLLTIFCSRAPKSDSAIECTWFLWKATGLQHFTVYSCWKTTCLPFKWHGLKLIALDVPQQSSCGHKAVAWHSDPSLNPILFGAEWSAQNTKPRTKYTLIIFYFNGFVLPLLSGLGDVLPNFAKAFAILSFELSALSILMPLLCVCVRMLQDDHSPTTVCSILLLRNKPYKTCFAHALLMSLQSETRALPQRSSSDDFSILCPRRSWSFPKAKG